MDRAVGIYWLGYTAVGAGGVPNATEVEFGVKITVIGLGYVGTVAAACLSDAGHDVTGVDIDSDRIGILQAGRVPFFEPGLEELLQASLGKDGCGLCTGMGSTARWVRWRWWRRARRWGRKGPST